MGVRAHSTRSVVASKAFLAVVPIQDICNAMGWSTPLTFIRFYGLDMRATPGSSALSPSSCSLRIQNRAGTWMSGSMGISFPKASYRTQFEFLKRNASSYVCNCVSLPHFLYPFQRFVSFLEADAGCIARTYYITPPVTSHPSFGLITHDIQSCSRWRPSLKRLTGRSVSFL